MVAATFFAVTSYAQTTINFDSHLSAVDTFDNGSNGGGSFDFESVTFFNQYDTSFNYYTGFAISTMTDSSTAGYQNQYSAVAAKGASGDGYAVYTGGGSIDFSNLSTAIQLEEVKITNTTYAAISMRDGDMFGKQFGSPNDASGEPDGTNGEDFFFVHIIGHKLNGDVIDTVHVTLADFRFADDSQDYILRDWITVDLSSLNGSGNELAYLMFDFTSSDVGAWGMNTPGYVALDDLKFSAAAGLPEMTTELSIYPNPTADFIQSNKDGELLVYNTAGQLVKNVNVEANERVQVSTLGAGVYTLRFINSEGQYTSRLIIR